MDGLINHRLYKKENKIVRFSEETLKRIAGIILHYPADRKKSALLPVLHIAQQELGGYLSVDVMDYVASLLEIQPVEVYEVATFYSMFHPEPVGKYLIEVCQTGPCALCGGEHILDHLENVLGITNGGTTSDGMFTLKTVECLGSCGTAPVMQINTEFYESMTKEKVESVIRELKEKDNQQFQETRWAELF
ncbi:MAG: NAD(P)H-dependent oxidoreductase subunit E [Bacteroidetes bacterium]|nr:NAD(P)H-dependent oxidoreductase subunit E [Bacteroidota bacterium]